MVIRLSKLESAYNNPNFFDSLDCQIVSLVSKILFSISIDDVIFSYIKDLMKTLHKLYEKPSASNKVFLMKHLFKFELY